MVWEGMSGLIWQREEHVVGSYGCDRVVGFVKCGEVVD